MKNIFTKIMSTRKTKLFTLTLSAAFVLTGATVFAGFGPERPTYDWNNAAERGGSFVGPVFNSFVNTPTYGDERNFGRVAEVVNGQSPVQADFREEVNAQGGKEYWVRTFVHNDANQNTNCFEEQKDADGRCTQVDPSAPGVAKNTRVRIAIAGGVANGVDVVSYISADNAVNKNGQPLRTVYDSSTLVNDDQRFSVAYVPGSAILYNSAHQNGLTLPNGDSIVSASGVPVGYDQMNGNLPGCFEFSAYVYVKVKVSAPKLEITKQVRKVGETEWKESVDAKPGESVQWLVKVINTGSTVQNNVSASDLLPPHIEYIDGTAKWYSASQNGVALDFDQFEISDGDGGYGFGNYAANGGGFLVRFDTKVKDDFKECSVAIRNVAYTKSDESPEEQEDYADVKITKENCQPTTPPVTPPTPQAPPVTPTTLPVTGAGSVFGIFTATTAAGAMAHRAFQSRRNRG